MNDEIFIKLAKYFCELNKTEFNLEEYHKNCEDATNEFFSKFKESHELKRKKK